MSCIALLTDFGLRDWFVASMKGVILSINPKATIIDITHQIAPQDVEGAAFALAQCFRFFPAKTIFVSVVDPAVGSSRKAIVASAGGKYFVGPDNGVLSIALQREQNVNIRIIENPDFVLPKVSNTFHGRDIFAPVAAHLSKGISLKQFGRSYSNYKKIELPPLKYSGKTIEGRVVYIDYFGNAITNIENELLRCSPFGKEVKIRLKKISNIPFCKCYAEGKRGELIAVTGSCGYIELSAYMANAAQKWKINRSDKVTITAAR